MFDDWEENIEVCPVCEEVTSKEALEKYGVCDDCEAVNEHLYFKPAEEAEDDDADF